MDLGKFTNYYQEKMRYNLNKNKRLRAIEEFFHIEYDITISFASKEDCYSFIVNFINQNADEAEEILENIYNLMEYVYSSQNPYYISILSTELTSHEVFRKITKLFKRKVINRDFEYKLKNEIFFDSVKNIITFELDYEETVYNYISEERNRKSINSLIITFDLAEKKLISSKSPNEKSHTNILNLLTREGFKLTPIYILMRAQTIKNKNFTDFSPTTILVINLLLKNIKEMGYEITLDSINFTNSDSQAIQRMTLTGTDLLKAPEVLQRIHNGDAVHTLRITLMKFRKEKGEEVYFKTHFKIDLKRKLAFVFSDEDEELARNIKICIDIQNSLMNLIYDDETVEIGETLINEYLPKPPSFSERMLSVRKELLMVIEGADDRIAVKKYFVENFGIK